MTDQDPLTSDNLDFPDDSMFRVLVEGSIEGILVHRGQRPLFVNQAWAGMHGMTAVEVLEMDSVVPLIHPDDRDRMIDYMHARSCGATAPDRYEYRAIHKSGTVIWLENLVRTIEWCGQPAVQATIIDITRRKSAEQALSESEERFRRGFEDGPIGVSFVDRDLRILRVNRAFCAMLGREEADLLGKTTAELTFAEDIGADDRPMDTTRGEFSDFTVRKRYRHANGSVVWVRLSAHWIRDGAGLPLYRMTLIENVSERVQARLAMEASERRFRNLVEGSIQGILIHRGHDPVFVNDAWALMLGYTPEEVLAAESTLQFVAPHDHERLRAYARGRLSGDQTIPTRYEYQGLRRDGTLVWLENNVRIIEWNGAPAIQSTIIECGERKLRESQLRTFNIELERRVAERTAELKSSNAKLQKEIATRAEVELRLRESQALYESLVDAIPLRVARKDLEGRFVFANRALRKVFGKPLEEIVGRDDYAFSPPELADKYRDDDRRVIETGEPLDSVEVSDLGAEGERHIHTLKTPIRGIDGHIAGTQLIFWDVTEQVLADAARRAVQEELEVKNRDLTSLLYVVSHDLKEPVRAIQSFSTLVMQRAGNSLDERHRDFLQRVIDAAQRMQRLLDDVLMLSRAQRTVDPTDHIPLAEIAHDVLVQLRPRIDETHAKVVVSDSLPVVRGDRRWLTQALFNLVGNALKFSRPGIAPEIEIVEWTGRNDASAANGRVTGLMVRDRGTGIEAAHRERIFELFQRAVSRNVEGTGAGLAIVRQVAERHGGDAFMLAREGGGSDFVIELPAE